MTLTLGYEVPQGSKIHFGKSARLKREIEDKAVAIFYKNGFEEIATPSFNFTHFANRKYEDSKALHERKRTRDRSVFANAGAKDFGFALVFAIYKNKKGVAK